MQETIRGSAESSEEREDGIDLEGKTGRGGSKEERGSVV